MDAWLFEDLIRVFSLGSRQVLAGEEADITSSMLKSDDADTPAEDVYYNVESPTSGMVAFKDFPEEAAVMEEERTERLRICKPSGKRK